MGNDSFRELKFAGVEAPPRLLLLFAYPSLDFHPSVFSLYSIVVFEDLQDTLYLFRTCFIPSLVWVSIVGGYIEP